MQKALYGMFVVFLLCRSSGASLDSDLAQARSLPEAQLSNDTCAICEKPQITIAAQVLDMRHATDLYGKNVSRQFFVVLVNFDYRGCNETGETESLPILLYGNTLTIGAELSCSKSRGESRAPDLWDACRADEIAPIRLNWTDQITGEATKPLQGTSVSFPVTVLETTPAVVKDRIRVPLDEVTGLKRRNIVRQTLKSFELLNVGQPLSRIVFLPKGVVAKTREGRAVKISRLHSNIFSVDVGAVLKRELRLNH